VCVVFFEGLPKKTRNKKAIQAKNNRPTSLFFFFGWLARRHARHRMWAPAAAGCGLLLCELHDICELGPSDVSFVI
jgi:hypothetical protein